MEGCGIIIKNIFDGKNCFEIDFPAGGAYEYHQG